MKSQMWIHYQSYYDFLHTLELLKVIIKLFQIYFTPVFLAYSTSAEHRPASEVDLSCSVSLLLVM